MLVFIAFNNRGLPVRHPGPVYWCWEQQTERNRVVDLWWSCWNWLGGTCRLIDYRPLWSRDRSWLMGVERISHCHLSCVYGDIHCHTGNYCLHNPGVQCIHADATRIIIVCVDWLITGYDKCVMSLWRYYDVWGLLSRLCSLPLKCGWVLVGT